MIEKLNSLIIENTAVYSDTLQKIIVIQVQYSP